MPKSVLQSRFVTIAGSLVAIVLLLGIIQYVSLPSSNLMHRVLIDLGHAPIFAAIAYLVLKFSRAYSSENSEHFSIGDYAFAGLAVLSLAVISEAAQVASPERSASVSDILRDCAGGALALFIMAALSGPSSPRRRGLNKKVCSAAAFLLAAALLAPTVFTIAAYANKSASWPIIVGTNFRFERAFCDAYQSDVGIVSVPSRWRSEGPEKAFLVQLRVAGDSGIIMQELQHDWSNFSEVCYEITNLDQQPLKTRMTLGNHSAFLRSTSMHAVPRLTDKQSRAVHCVDLERSTQYRSLAVLAEKTNSANEFLVHRIWLQ